ncbi:6-phosphogluconolactonase [Penicillium lividum]|nr:6-phosphogluconolactonase [Penicillium lividum]
MANIYSYEDKDLLCANLKSYLVRAEADALERHNTFRVAVSGGSLPKMLSDAIFSDDDRESLHFNKWEIFFADERAVPLDHMDSNYGLLKEELLNNLDATGIEAPPVRTIDEQASQDSDPEELAKLYQDDLKRTFGED